MGREAGDMGQAVGRVYGGAAVLDHGRRVQRLYRNGVRAAIERIFRPHQGGNGVVRDGVVLNCAVAQLSQDIFKLVEGVPITAKST